MLTLIRRIEAPGSGAIATLSLTAADRSKSRHRFTTTTGEDIYLNLPRGTVLRGGDRLASEDGQVVEVLAKPQPVLTVMANDAVQLMRAAYHLGNRHVPVEITATYLRLEPDPVLRAMVEQLGLTVMVETAPFEPEAGAYGGAHSHD
ncbi:urease accessory protein UreE [filamentous cyanobacterium CCP5]|nr:urease accessory protein UreE [filamentous cyanobacterium CCP5]